MRFGGRCDYEVPSNVYFYIDHPLIENANKALIEREGERNKNVIQY